MKRLSRIRGLVGFALGQLGHDRARTGFAIVGVAFAVLSVTLLFGVGAGVVQTGETLLDQSQQDLWVSGGPVEIQPGTVGGFQNPVVDSHTVAAQMEAHEDVRVAVPLAFQVVYISTDGKNFDTIIGSGTRSGGPLVKLQNGTGFSSNDQAHYAGGNYTGPMSHEVIIDPATAEEYDLEVGDTVYIGGSISNARRNEFTVVGISPTFRQFVGAKTVTLPLSELQTVTGTAYDDRATIITVRLEDGADREAVRSELEASYPEYTIRTNREQFRAVLERQALVITGGISLVALAVLAGMLLSLNLFLSFIYQQRVEFAVFRALGGSHRSTVAIAVLQATLIASAGCLLGLVLTPPLAAGIDSVATAVTGFEGLVQIPPEGYLVGVGVAGVFGLLGTVGGVLRVARAQPATHLTR